MKHIIDELKRKTKEAKSRIDWSEINNKKESIIDEVKQLKHDFDENQRKKKEDQLYQKDFEFKELENEEKRIEKPKRSIIDTCTTKVKEAYNEAIKEAKEEEEKRIENKKRLKRLKEIKKQKRKEARRKIYRTTFLLVLLGITLIYYLKETNPVKYNEYSLIAKKTAKYTAIYTTETWENLLVFYKKHKEQYEKNKRYQERLEEKERIAKANSHRLQMKADKEKREISAAKEKIITHFSFFTGAHKNLQRYIKDTLHDPGSYKHVETSYKINADRKTYNVTTVFRAKNGFGAVRTNQVSAKVSINNGDILNTTWN